MVVQMQMMGGCHHRSSHIHMMVRRRMEVWVRYRHGRGRSCWCIGSTVAQSVGVGQERRRNDFVVEAAPKAKTLQRVAVVAMRQRRAAQVNAGSWTEQLHGAQIVWRTAARGAQRLCLSLRLAASRSRAAAQHAKRRRGAQLRTATGRVGRRVAAHRVARRERRRDGT